MHSLLDIRPVGEREVLMTWEDEHRSLYENISLRSLCPCAHCVDEWTGKRTVSREQISPTLRMVKWEPVGRYGVKFQWSDGHQTGIYSFDYLRQICPCEACRGGVTPPVRNEP